MPDIFITINGQKFRSSGDKSKDVKFLSEQFPENDFKSLRSQVYTAHTGEAPVPPSIERNRRYKEQSKAEHYLAQPGESPLPSAAKSYGDAVINALTFGQAPALTAGAQALAPSLATTPNAQEYIGSAPGFAEKYQRAKELQDLTENKQFETDPLSTIAGSLTGAIGGGQQAITNAAYKALFGAEKAAPAVGALSRLASGIKEGAKQGVASVPAIEAMMPGDSSLKERAGAALLSPVAGGVVGGGLQGGGELLNVVPKFVGGTGRALSNMMFPEMLLSQGANIPRDFFKKEEGQAMPLLTRMIKIARDKGFKGSGKQFAQQAEAEGSSAMDRLAANLSGKEIPLSALKKNIKVPETTADLETNMAEALAAKMAPTEKKFFQYRQAPGQDAPEEATALAAEINREKQLAQEGYSKVDEATAGQVAKLSDKARADALRATIEDVSPIAREENQNWYAMNQLAKGLGEVGKKGKTPERLLSGIDLAILGAGPAAALAAGPEAAMAAIPAAVLGVVGKKLLQAVAPRVALRTAVPAQKAVDAAMRFGKNRITPELTGKLFPSIRTMYQDQNL